MRFQRLLTWGAALACCFLFSGCLDYDEEMWINSDLSGHATLHLTLPDPLKDSFAGVNEQFSQEKLQKRFDAASGVKLVSYELSEDKRRPELRIEVQFSSLEALSKAIEANDPAAALAGKFTIVKENGQLKITRQLGTVEPKGEIGEGVAMYVMHFPQPLEYTNTTLHDGAHDTVRYRYKLEEIFRNSPALINTLPKTLPWKMIGLIGGTVLLVIYLLWALLKKK